MKRRPAFKAGFFLSRMKGFELDFADGVSTGMQHHKGQPEMYARRNPLINPIICDLSLFDERF